jgi:hypothetical protein
MIDLAWLPEVGKWAGGIVVGYVGKTFEGRSKRKKLRRGLYREMLSNYISVRHTIDAANKLPHPPARVREVSLRVEMVSTDYYQYAKKDMEAFADIPEAAAFDWFNRKLQSMIEMRDGGLGSAVPLFNSSLALVHTTEESFVAGTFDCRFARKVLGGDSFAFVSQCVEAMRQHGIQPNEYPWNPT